MKCAIIRNDHSIEQGITLSHVEAVELSKLAENAAILDLSESPSGYQVIYQDGVVRMYDPVNNVIIGKHAEFNKRNGWI